MTELNSLPLEEEVSVQEPVQTGILNRIRTAIARNLRLKISVWIGVLLMIASIILVAYSTLTARQTAIKTATEDTLDKAQAEAAFIRAEAEIPLDTARALAQALTAIKNPNQSLSLNRDDVNAMLNQVLVENPTFLGTYTLWEPNAFDGLDAQYQGTESHDETGRFIPYWVREGNEIFVIPLEQYETPGIGDWYLEPRETKKETVIAPLIYPIQGVDTTMASFVAPIVYEGQFYGIVGVDQPITFAQEVVDNINLYDGNVGAALLTSSGTLVSVRNQPELVNQPATKIFEDFADLQEKIAAGESFVSPSTDGESLRVFSPIDLGRTGDQWFLSLTIPYSEITAEATTAAFVQAGIGLALLMLALFVLWYLSGQVVRPLQKLTKVAGLISEGNLEETAEVTSEDEVGVLAQTFNSMVLQLRNILTTLEQRVAERTQNLELAAEVGQTISQVSDLDTMLTQAAELILEQFDLYYVQVYLTDEQHSLLTIEAGTGAVGKELLERKHSLPISNASINGHAAMDRRAVVIPDTSQSATFLKNPLLPETRGEMAIPLIAEDHVVGVLDMQSSQPNVLTEEVLPAFEVLAGQLAVAIENAKLLEETEQARAEVEAQARRQVRVNWDEHLDAIHKPEQIGYSFDQNEVAPLNDVDEENITEAKNTVSAPISFVGEELGSLMVEIDDEEKTAQTRELVNIVARQIAQQLENVRLLENAERYRQEAEGVLRRQTREGWEAYLASREGKNMSYMYDSAKVIQVEDESEENSAFSLPLKIRDAEVGKLTLQDISPEDEESQSLSTAIAERLSAHIETLRLGEQSRSALAETQNLYNASRELTSASTPTAVAEALVKNIDRTNLDRILVALLDTKKSQQIEAEVPALWDRADQLQPGNRFTEKQIPLLKTLSPHEIFIVNNFDTATNIDEQTRATFKYLDVKSAAIIPISVGEKRYGWLLLETITAYRNFHEKDLAPITALTGQTAVILESQNLLEETQKQAEREATLNAISQKIQSATSVEAVLQIAARELGHALGAPMTIAQLSIKDQA